tara:strand:+ start:2733 stop:2930 length:198 start_codon:yes stop_codon:yes gene_type:complete
MPKSWSHGDSVLKEITKEMFEEYKKVQESGKFNMLEPRAREGTSLDRRQWYIIISNYDRLKFKYS